MLRPFESQARLSSLWLLLLRAGCVDVVSAQLCTCPPWHFPACYWILDRCNHTVTKKERDRIFFHRSKSIWWTTSGLQGVYAMCLQKLSAKNLGKTEEEAESIWVETMQKVIGEKLCVKDTRKLVSEELPNDCCSTTNNIMSSREFVPSETVGQSHPQKSGVASSSCWCHRHT